MAIYSSILAWRVMKIPWRREWQSTPVSLPGEFRGQRSLGATVHRVAELDTATFFHEIPRVSRRGHHNSNKTHFIGKKIKEGHVKKAEHRKMDTFELWCWRRLLRVPWTARRSTQSILKEISPGCSLAGLMLKLKLQYFGHLM